MPIETCNECSCIIISGDCGCEDKPHWGKSTDVGESGSATGCMEWISAQDRVPETTYEVLVCYQDSDLQRLCCGYYMNDTWHTCDDRGEDGNIDMPVTHWMPLPGPPNSI